MSGERGSRWLKAADKWLGIPLAAAAAFWRHATRRSHNPESAQRIGILCLGAIGDLLLLSALTAAIKERLPDCQLEIITSSANACALALNPHADAHFAAPIRAVPTLLSHIRRRGYDVLIDSSQWARLGALLCDLSGAGAIAGFATKGQLRATGYDITCSHSSECHEVENFLNLGRALWPGISGAPCIRLPKGRSWESSGTVFCHMWPAQGQGRLLKMWPEGHWARLIAELLKQGLAVALTGSKADAAASAMFLKRHFPREKRVRSLAGKCGITELAGLLAGAAGAVSVNTGIMHLAALSGCPTVALHGATNPQRWGPIGPRAISLLPDAGASAYLNLGWEYPKGAKPAMQNIPVERVISALDKAKSIKTQS